MSVMKKESRLEEIIWDILTIVVLLLGLFGIFGPMLLYHYGVIDHIPTGNVDNPVDYKTFPVPGPFGD